MRKMYLLLLAAAVSGCVIEYGNKNEVTNGSLWHYGNAKIAETVCAPAYELALYLFTDAYRTADEQQRAGMLKKHGLEGKFHQMDGDTFHLDGFGDINTGGRPFAENGWGTGWKNAEEEVWIRNTSVETTAYVPGIVPPDNLDWDGDIKARCTRDQDGDVTGISVEFSQVRDISGKLTAVMTLPDGPFTISNPLVVSTEYFYHLIFSGPVAELPGLSLYGTMDIRILDGNREVDWAILKATGKSCAESATTSRD